MIKGAQRNYVYLYLYLDRKVEVAMVYTGSIFLQITSWDKIKFQEWTLGEKKSY